MNHDSINQRTRVHQHFKMQQDSHRRLLNKNVMRRLVPKRKRAHSPFSSQTCTLALDAIGRPSDARLTVGAGLHLLGKRRGHRVGFPAAPWIAELDSGEVERGHCGLALVLRRADCHEGGHARHEPRRFPPGPHLVCAPRRRTPACTRLEREESTATPMAVQKKVPSPRTSTAFRV